MGDVYWGPHVPLAAIAAEAGISTAIETGTYFAVGSLQLASLFEQVISIESNEKLHRFCEQTYESVDNIEFICADSGSVLKEILLNIDQAAFIFLDAHWFPAKALGDPSSSHCPLNFELDAMRDSAAFAKGSILVIDDADMFLGSLPVEKFHAVDFPSIAEIILKLKQDMGAQYVDVFDDVIVAGPSWLEDRIKNYMDLRSKVGLPSAKKISI